MRILACKSILGLVILLAFTSCEKKNFPPTAEITISPETGNLETIFSIDASNSSDTEDDASNLLVRWDWSSDGTWDTEFSTNKLINRQFSEAGTYTIVLEVKDSKGLLRSTNKRLLVSPDLPITKIIRQEIIDFRTVEFSIELVSDGGGIVEKVGICWSYRTNPTKEDKFKEILSDKDLIVITVDDLASDINYFFRPYAINDSGISYGEEVTAITSPELASIMTGSVSDIKSISANCSGIIVHDGGTEIFENGICWSMQSNPTISDSKKVDISHEENFTIELTSLKSNTEFFFKAYAINAIGISYGEESSFSTLAGVPTVETSEAYEITQNSAKAGGNIINDGGLEMFARGICWSKNPAPSLNDMHTSDGAESGTFISAISGLEGNTNYYARAYGTNPRGTAYGSEIEFKTMPIAPSVKTNEPFFMSDSECFIDGEVISNGGAYVSGRGFCWSTSANPTLNDEFAVEGGGSGKFAYEISNLPPSTQYHLRAWASNNVGTSYGNEITFTTSSNSISGTFRDERDLTVYPWVIIGGQTWMAKNLAYLPKVFPRTYESYKLRHYYVYAYGGFIVSEAKDNRNFQRYGVLYNWIAAVDGKIGSEQVPSDIQGSCPEGWHIPSVAEWTILLEYLGDDNAEKLKSETGWLHDRNGNNSSGFSALPAGYVAFLSSGSSFQGEGDYTYFWSASDYTDTHSTAIKIDPWKSEVIMDWNIWKTGGYSVRCLKD
jgi:uncharacterized protein (TIGR02145 family)